MAQLISATFRLNSSTPRKTAPSEGDPMSFEIAGFEHGATLFAGVADGLGDGEAAGAVGESTRLQDESRTRTIVAVNLFPEDMAT